MNNDELKRYPSTQTLVGFVTVARTLSFARAAEQLNLSASAISKQLSELESLLGCELFKRTTRQMTLTSEGEEYLTEVQESLRRIEDATLRLRAKRGFTGQLDVAVSPTFCNRWLIPRLASFYTANPEIRLNLQTSIGLPDLRLLRVDCAIAFCEASAVDGESEQVMPLKLWPVVSPVLLKKLRKQNWRSALCSHPLLDQLTLPHAWDEFLSLAGIDARTTRRGARYQLLALGHQAALVGLGSALLPDYLVADDIRRGALARLGDLELKTKADYRLIVPEHARNRGAFRAFREWLLANSVNELIAN